MIPYTRLVMPDPKRYAQLVAGVFERGRVSNYGPLVTQFESMAKGLIFGDSEKGSGALISTCNGDAALRILMQIAGARGAKRVLVSDWTFQSTINAVLHAGLRPVICGFSDTNFGIHGQDVEENLDRHDDGGSVVLVTHAHGSTKGYSGIADILAQRSPAVDLYVDAAHAFRRCVPIGDGAAFSLSGTKVVVAGEGGALALRDHRLQDTARMIGNYGFLHNYVADGPIGINAKMSELHAAMAIASMEGFDEEVAQRAILASAYDSLLPGGVASQRRGPADVLKDYLVRFQSGMDCEMARGALGGAEIETKRYFRPLSSQPAYEQWWPRRLTMDVSLSIWGRCLCLPFGGGITVSEAEQVCDVIRRALR